MVALIIIFMFYVLLLRRPVPRPHRILLYIAQIWYVALLIPFNYHLGIQFFGNLITLS